VKLFSHYETAEGENVFCRSIVKILKALTEVFVEVSDYNLSFILYGPIIVMPKITDA
jgi:hypothetical protein